MPEIVYKALTIFSIVYILFVAGLVMALHFKK